MSVINMKYFLPSDYKGIETVYLYKCDCDNCPLKKKGQCLLCYTSFYGKKQTCPFGEIDKIEGYTKRSSHFGELVRNNKILYDDRLDVLSAPKYYAEINKYVWTDLPYIQSEEQFRDKIKAHLIKKTDWTPAFIVEMINYDFGDTRQKEQYLFDKQKVFFLQELKRQNPRLFNEVLTLQPSISTLLSNVDYRGKKAVLRTLNKGKVRVGKDILLWDGQYLYANSSVLKSIDAKKVIIEPSDNMSVEIVENETINNKTEFC